MSTIHCQVVSFGFAFRSYLFSDSVLGSGLLLFPASLDGRRRNLDISFWTRDSGLFVASTTVQTPKPEPEFDV